MVDSDTLRKSNFYTDIVTEAYTNGEGEAISVSTIDKRVVSVSGWISCKCNIDESMGVKIISPEGVKRVKNIEELEDSTMAYYVDFRNAEILFTKDLTGKTIYYEYYGTGVDRLCVNRIYTDLDNYGNILMTLEDMTNDYVQILKCLEGIENLDTKLNELKLSIKSSDISIDELAESILIASQQCNKLNNEINTSNESFKKLESLNRESLNTANVLTIQNNIANDTNIPNLTNLLNTSQIYIEKFDGEDGLIEKSQQKIDSLNEKINDSISHESTLNSLNILASTHEDKLGNSNNGLIKQSSDHETLLETKINSATTKESSLQDTINNADSIKTELTKLNNVVTNTTIEDMKSKKEQCETAISNLNEALENGQVVKKTEFALDVDISREDLYEKITKTGVYYGANCVNAPVQNTYFFYQAYVYYKTKRIIAYDMNTDDIYSIRCKNDVWDTSWLKL